MNEGDEDLVPDEAALRLLAIEDIIVDACQGNVTITTAAQHIYDLMG